MPLSSIYRTAAIVCSVLVFAGCAQLPPREVSTALETQPIDTSQTRLARALAPAIQEHPERSGVRLIENGRDAFATRVLLAEAAERTLDVQYYIWRDDVSGRMMFDALTRAAERGVRVRLLLDDLGTTGLDEKLAALDAHPLIEVRLFNPFPQRGAKYLGFLTDFSRLNRRMHSKSFTVDQQATVVGGRNVADAYFGATTETLFVDLDVLAVGPVAQKVDKAFERFWDSASAYPISQLRSDKTAPAPPTVSLAPLATQIQNPDLSPEVHAYLQAVTQSTFVASLLAQRVDLEWAPVHLVSDEPEKVLGEETEASLLRSRMARIVGKPKTEFYLVSPYFVPTQNGYDWFAGLRKDGVKIKVLTNALESTDVTAVHAGYARWRRPLLEAGVELYETRRVQIDKDGERDKKPQRSQRSQGSGSGLGLSSGESLHAKTFAVDRQTLFVGSFNFDPRSVRLNTEIGLLIESPHLAGMLAKTFDEQVAQQSYEPRVGPDGRIKWFDEGSGTPGQPVVFEHEPNVGFWRSFYVRFLQLLPIDSML